MVVSVVLVKWWICCAPGNAHVSWIRNTSSKVHNPYSINIHRKYSTRVVVKYPRIVVLFIGNDYLPILPVK